MPWSWAKKKAIQKGLESLGVDKDTAKGVARGAMYITAAATLDAVSVKMDLVEEGLNQVVEDETESSIEHHTSNQVRFGGDDHKDPDVGSSRRGPVFS